MDGTDELMGEEVCPMAVEVHFVLEQLGMQVVFLRPGIVVEGNLAVLAVAGQPLGAAPCGQAERRSVGDDEPHVAVAAEADDMVQPRQAYRVGREGLGGDFVGSVVGTVQRLVAAQFGTLLGEAQLQHFVEHAVVAIEVGLQLQPLQGTVGAVHGLGERPAHAIEALQVFELVVLGGFHHVGADVEYNQLGRAALEIRGHAEVEIVHLHPRPTAVEAAEARLPLDDAWVETVVSPRRSEDENVRRAVEQRLDGVGEVVLRLGRMADDQLGGGSHHKVGTEEGGGKQSDEKYLFLH